MNNFGPASKEAFRMDVSDVLGAHNAMLFPPID